MAASWTNGLRLHPGESRSALRMFGVLAALGVPAGLLWLVLAPRRQFEVVDGGFRALEPQSEALIGADGWLLVITAALGLLAAAAVWLFVRSRGAGIVLGLAAGLLACSIIAWQVGELLGSGPTADELTDIGTVVTAGLELRAIPVLVGGSFLATLLYLVAVSFVAGDDLDRTAVSSGWTGSPTASAAPVPLEGPPAPSTPDAATATGPPTGQWSGPPPAVLDGPRQ